MPRQSKRNQGTTIIRGTLADRRCIGIAADRVRESNTLTLRAEVETSAPNGHACDGSSQRFTHNGGGQYESIIRGSVSCRWLGESVEWTTNKPP